MPPRTYLAAIAAALALFAVACKKGDSGEASKETMALLPEDANVFFGARLSELSESKLWKDYVAPQLADDEDYQDMVEACGKDLIPELESVVGAANTETEMLSVVLRGITRAELETCSENSEGDNAFTLSDEDELVVFTDSEGDKTYMHWIDDDSVLVAGPTDDANEDDEAAQKQALLDRLAAEESLADNETMMELIGDLDTGDSLYAAAIVESIAGNPLAGEWQSAAGSVDVSDGVTIDVRAGFSSAEVAEEFSKKADAVIGMAVMKPELEWIPDLVELSVEETFIVGNAELSEEDVGKLEELVESGAIPLN